MAPLFPLLLLAVSVIEIYEAAKLQLPEAHLTTPELIKYWGYPAESHEVVTSDGYVLTVHRIPHGKVKPTVDENKPRPAFFLQHPLLSSSSDWVINLPWQSLGFVLADHGFDVWLGNVRGNTYSKKHVSLKVTSKAFWDFSFDDHAKYDFPAMIHYVLNKTGQEQLFYVGHSQGTMMAFAGLSENEELQSKIKMNFALAPVSRIRHINRAVRMIAYWEGKLAFLFRLFGIREFYPSSKWGTKFQETVCYWLPKMCKLVITMISGQDRKYLNETRLPVYVAHTPAGTSSKNMLHFFQLVNSKLFSKYDYGILGNLVHYKSKVPPEYDITKVRTPTVIISGSHDTLAAPEDVKWTIAQLPKVIEHYEIKDYNHLDFIWGINAGKVLHEKIIDIARRCCRFLLRHNNLVELDQK